MIVKTSLEFFFSNDGVAIVGQASSLSETRTGLKPVLLELVQVRIQACAIFHGFTNDLQILGPGTAIFRMIWTDEPAPGFCSGLGGAFASGFSDGGAMMGG